MVDATTTSLGGNTSTHSEQSSSLTTSTSYQCTSCQVSFTDSQEQRAHMKQPWHVYNVKRKIASLAPISLDAFKSKIQSTEEPSQAKNEESEGQESSESDQDSEESVSPCQCLFCSQSFTNDEDGFASNLDHMTMDHGLHIPDQEMVEDIETLIGYLATEVRVWHECLYCGATKPTTSSIQSHMRDKGHCQLNLDREPELLEFWDRIESSSDEATKDHTVDDKEMRFASGKIVTSRKAGPSSKRASRKRNTMALVAAKTEESTQDSDTPQPTSNTRQSSGRQLARRGEMGIIGVSEQQRHALVLAEKKAQRSEAIARRAREWVHAKGANSQKYDQIDTTGFKGKQNHKLMPR